MRKAPSLLATVLLIGFILSILAVGIGAVPLIAFAAAFAVVCFSEVTDHVARLNEGSVPPYQTPYGLLFCASTIVAGAAPLVVANQFDAWVGFGTTILGAFSTDFFVGVFSASCALLFLCLINFLIPNYRTNLTGALFEAPKEFEWRYLLGFCGLAFVLVSDFDDAVFSVVTATGYSMVGFFAISALVAQVGNKFRARAGKG